MSLRDQKYKEEHLKNLGPKKGYQGNKDWDNLIVIASKYKDSDVLNKILSIESSGQTETAQYIYDLYQIYKAQPDFFVTTAYKFYKDDMNCVVRTFKTNPPILSEEEITKDFNVKSQSSIFKKYVSLSKATDFSKEDMKKTAEIAAKCNLLKKQKL